MRSELIARLKQATGPDRAIDLEIARLRNAVVMRRNWEDTANEEYTHWHYTADITDALSLVPEGWTGFVGIDAEAETWLWPRDGTMSKGFRIAHKIPAIALCIAALKAPAHD